MEELTGAPRREGLPLERLEEALNVKMEPQVEIHVESKRALRLQAADRVDINVRVDPTEDVLLAQDVKVEEEEDLSLALQACNVLGTDCGSIVIDTPLGEDDTWEEQGFRKQFFLPLPRPEQHKPDASRMLAKGAVEGFKKTAEQILQMDLQCGVSVDQRPYLYSLDLSPDLEDRNPEFCCFLHFHELTGAVYVEKVVIPSSHSETRLA